MWLNSVSVFLLLLSNYVTIALEVNDACSLNNGASGVCTLAKDCEPAKRAMQNRRPHNLARCGFDIFDEIVCCPSLNSNKFGSMRRSEQECMKILKASLRPIGGLIIGGEVAEFGEFPYVVALGYDKGDGIEFSCGGSVISKNFVLTAAHCIETRDGFYPSVVRAGVISWDSTEWNEDTDVAVAERIPHPNFSRREKYHDLGLLRLEKSLVFTTFLNAVCLETDVNDPTQTLTIVGWGQTNNNRVSRSSTLLKTNVTAVGRSVCAQTYNERTYSKLPRGLIPEMFCAGDPTGAHDACQGDSGGPILVPGASGHYRVVGITSFGKGCGSPLPSIYTRVPMYLDWIESVVWPN